MRTDEKEQPPQEAGRKEFTVSITSPVTFIGRLRSLLSSIVPIRVVRFFITCGIYIAKLNHMRVSVM